MSTVKETSKVHSNVKEEVDSHHAQKIIKKIDNDMKIEKKEEDINLLKKRKADEPLAKVLLEPKKSKNS